jgi:hypothetical protein
MRGHRTESGWLVVVDDHDDQDDVGIDVGGVDDVAVARLGRR